MTHDPDPLEDALRRLHPAPTSSRLAGEIATALATEALADTPQSSRPASIRQRAALWLPWGIAAAMTVAFFSRHSTPPTAVTSPPPAETANPVTPSTDAARFQPVSSSNVLVRAQDEGLVVLEDGRPARKVRYEYLDTIQLLSTDASRATVNVSYPREEIRLVPLQTF